VDVFGVHALPKDLRTRAGVFPMSKRRAVHLTVAAILFGLGASVPAPGSAAVIRTPALLQTPGVAGVVISSDTGRPVDAVAVQVEGLRIHAFTDAAGRFRLTGLPPGDHVLVVTRLGYLPQRVQLQAEVEGGGGGLQVEVRLEPDPVLISGVVVSASGDLQRRVETPASISRVEGDRIREVNPSHPAEIMNRVPGVWVSPTSTEGHMTAIRQPITTKPVYLFLEDGVPTRSPGFFNHNALYEVNVPQSDRIEIIRGPGTALYGSDAIGGVIDVGTRAASPIPQVEGTLEGNSLGFGRALLSASGSRGRDGLRLDLNITEGDSWRNDADYNRQSGTVRWDRTLESGIQLRTTATYSRVYQEDPSVVTRADLESDPAVNYHPITYRSVDAFRLTSHLERRTDRSLLQVSPFLRWNSLDLMPSWMLNFDPVIYESGHSSLGIMTRYHRDLAPFPGRLTVGVDLDRSPGSRVEDRISVTREGGIAVAWTRQDRLYDYEAVFLGVSPYAQLALRPLDRLHLTAGLRYDDVGFRYATRLDPTQEGRHRRPDDTSVRYSNLGPSLGAALTLSPELNLFTSFRESFRSPSEGQLFRQGAAESTVDLNPVKAGSVEGGVRGEVAARLAYEVAFYRMEVRDDILTFTRPEDGLNESLNAGRTRHQGVEAGVTLAFPGGVQADLSLSRASHRYLEWSPRGDVSYAGNRIEQAPRDLASSRIRSPIPGLGSGMVELEWLRMGRFWMDPANRNEYEGHDLWNIRFEIPVGQGVSASGRVLNLADRVYAERASFNAFRGEELSPGKPRTFFFGLRYRWN